MVVSQESPVAVNAGQGVRLKRVECLSVAQFEVLGTEGERKTVTRHPDVEIFKS
jgi:hypothetical protein